MHPVQISKRDIYRKSRMPYALATAFTAPLVWALSIVMNFGNRTKRVAW